MSNESQQTIAQAQPLYNTGTIIGKTLTDLVAGNISSDEAKKTIADLGINVGLAALQQAKDNPTQFWSSMHDNAIANLDGMLNQAVQTSMISLTNYFEVLRQQVVAHSKELSIFKILETHAHFGTITREVLDGVAKMLKAVREEHANIIADGVIKNAMTQAGQATAQVATDKSSV